MHQRQEERFTVLEKWCLLIHPTQHFQADWSSLNKDCEKNYILTLVQIGHGLKILTLVSCPFSELLIQVQSCNKLMHLKPDSAFTCVWEPGWYVNLYKGIHIGLHAMINTSGSTGLSRFTSVMALPENMRGNLLVVNEPVLHLKYNYSLNILFSTKWTRMNCAEYSDANRFG